MTPTGVPASVHPLLVKALTNLAAVYAHSLTEETLEQYGEALSDLPPEDVRSACIEIAKVERYWPRPVIIRDCVDRLQRLRQPAPRQIAATAAPGGETWACDVCQDRGMYPRSELGLRLSWDAVRGVGEFEGRPVRRDHVKRCDVCNKFAAPKARQTQPTYDERKQDRRGWPPR